jgi:CRISPR/Cas system endoribonuclease Cas6 (RAMP superfamily)
MLRRVLELAHFQVPGADLADLLRAAEILHVGKGATFGLGKVEVA